MSRTILSIFLLIVFLTITSNVVDAYYVRIRDLSVTPTPPNPITVSGRVTSVSPLTINDGSGDVVITGLTAALDEYLVVRGNWNGSTIAATGHCTIIDGVAQVELVYIQGGSFLMGNNGNEPYSYDDELPQHSVSLCGYWIGKYEVTRGEYQKFMDAGGYTNSAYWSTEGWSWRVSSNRTQPIFWAPQQNWGTGTFTQTDKHPVVGVTYYEAEAFCNWAGGRLPTEAEWEKAARWAASHSRVYPWGDLWHDDKCNNWNDSVPAGGGYRKCQTSPVGSYTSGVSPYGLQDMAGNVAEWVKDWYSDTYYSATPPGGWVNPQGPASGSGRVCRGGSWTDYDDYCRAAIRNSTSPSSSRYNLGFRLAR